MAQNTVGKSMNDTVWATIGKNLPPIVGNWWLWLENRELAWWVSMLTILYIISQLFWGWSKYLRRGNADVEL